MEVAKRRSPKNKQELSAGGNEKVWGAEDNAQPKEDGEMEGTSTGLRNSLSLVIASLSYTYRLRSSES
jgi:hypothetical protein